MYGRLLIILFFFFSYLVHAQSRTVSGTISDADTGETLFGVNIMNQELGVGAISNEYGFYSIQLPQGNTSLQFSYLGYTSIVTELKGDDDISLPILLKEGSTELEEVIVTAEEDEIRSRITRAEMSTLKLDANTIKEHPRFWEKPMFCNQSHYCPVLRMPAKVLQDSMSRWRSRPKLSIVR